MSEPLVIVDHVSKKFCRNLKRSLWYGVKDVTSELFGRSKDKDPLRKDEFWAVDNVSFELKRGECLGLIGHNGAGKSTLLKMLNGLIKPDKGEITMKGRVGALIELGAGFNPVLTGRENIYINGAVLGFSKQQINQKLEAIVDFAEIESFIDSPVQNYSSGMKVRLGFAVASQMEPDVLIIDEVLAVGDVGFKIKCFNAISEISKDAAVIFVSHSMPQVARICNKLVLMNGGTECYNGHDVLEGVQRYYSFFKTGSSRVFGVGVDLGSVFLNSRDVEENVINYLEDLDISLEIKLNNEVRFLKIESVFFDMELKPIASCFSEAIDASLIKGKVSFKIPKVQFGTGEYSMTLNFFSCDSDNGKERYEILSKYENIKTFKVNGTKVVTHVAMQLFSEWRLN